MTKGATLFLTLTFLVKCIENFNCQQHSDCAIHFDDDFMICGEDHTCVCNPDEEDLFSEVAEVSPNETRCQGVPLVGEHCDPSSTPWRLCSLHSFCNADTLACECLPGFELYSVEKKCRKGFGSKCSSSEECNPEKFLECSSTSGDCACVEGNESVKYDPLLDTCVVPLGGQCELIPWGGIQLLCGQNATCQSDSGDSHYGQCKCRPGFYSPDEGNVTYNCLEVVGKICLGDKECAKYGSEYSCNNETSTCDCSPGLVYQRLSCKSKVSSECQNDEECVKHSKCDALKCVCTPDFLATGRGECELGLHKPCGVDLKCHSDMGLICREGVCRCSEGQRLSNVSQKCLIKAHRHHGARCDSSKRCTENAHCDNNLCICNDSFIPGEEDGTCDYGFDTICDPSRSDQCPSELGLRCSHEGRCGCNNTGSLYDPKVKKCLLKVGETCSSSRHTNDRRCVTTAFCGTGSKCQCYVGYDATPEGHCVLRQTTTSTPTTTTTLPPISSSSIPSSTSVQQYYGQEFREEAKKIVPYSTSDIFIYAGLTLGVFGTAITLSHFAKVAKYFVLPSSQSTLSSQIP